MGDALLTAIALLLILEGFLPLLSPALWREMFRRVAEMRDGQIRYVGLSLVLAGGALLLLLSLRN